MRPNRIVGASPRLDHNPGLRERVEDLDVEQFVAQLAIEALDIAVFAGLAFSMKARRRRGVQAALADARLVIC
jgi:hypothetical protein